MVPGHRIGLIGLQNLSKLTALCDSSSKIYFVKKKCHTQIHHVGANASSGSAKRSARDPELTAPT